MKFLFRSFFILIFIVFANVSSKAQAILDLETGAVFTGYNDVQIPGDRGTRFSLKDQLTPDAEFFYRLRLSYTIKSRHTVSLLYAPLETESEGRIAQTSCSRKFYFSPIHNLTASINSIHTA